MKLIPENDYELIHDALLLVPNKGIRAWFVQTINSNDSLSPILVKYFGKTARKFSRFVKDYSVEKLVLYAPDIEFHTTNYGVQFEIADYCTDEEAEELVIEYLRPHVSPTVYGTHIRTISALIDHEEYCTRAKEQQTADCSLIDFFEQSAPSLLDFSSPRDFAQ